MGNLCVVVVTYNRKDYLKKLIIALENQSVKPDSILLFDNHSTDGTDTMLKEMIITKSCEEGVLTQNEHYYYYRNTSNSGGSGGFNKAIELAYGLGFEYIWCMDDDVLPDQNCLEELLNNIDESSLMCIPTRTDNKYTDHAVVDFNLSNPFKYKIAYKKRYLNNDEIKTDTINVVDMPFEGPLFSRDVVTSIGLPNKELFIIFDDTEFAYRALQCTKIKYVKTAILHKQIIPCNDGKRLMGWKDYYGYRNQIWFDRKYGENTLVKAFRPRLLILDLMLRAVVKRKWTNIKVLKKAYVDGMAGRLGKLVEPGTKGADF